MKDYLSINRASWLNWYPLMDFASSQGQKVIFLDKNRYAKNIGRNKIRSWESNISTNFSRIRRDFWLLITTILNFNIY